MSTKKEKCCENCWKYNGDPDGNVGGFYVCSDPLCPCHQSESIEWEEKSVAALRGIGVEDHIPAIIKLISIVREEAITTAVSKRDAYLVEEIEKRKAVVETHTALPKAYFEGYKQAKNDFLQIIKH